MSSRRMNWHLLNQVWMDFHRPKWTSLTTLSHLWRHTTSRWTRHWETRYLTWNSRKRLTTLPLSLWLLKWTVKSWNSKRSHRDSKCRNTCTWGTTTRRCLRRSRVNWLRGLTSRRKGNWCSYCSRYGTLKESCSTTTTIRSFKWSSSNTIISARFHRGMTCLFSPGMRKLMLRNKLFLSQERAVTE